MGKPPKPKGSLEWGTLDHGELGVPTLSLEEDSQVQTVIKWSETLSDEMSMDFCLNLTHIEDLLGCPHGRPFTALKASSRMTLEKGKWEVVVDLSGVGFEKLGLPPRGAAIA